MASENTLRFVKLDYQSHKDAMLQRVRSRWPRAWNDFLNNSFGMLIVDLIAWATSTLAFTINRAVSENLVPTMTLRESAVRVGAFFGYKLRNPFPATVQCEATLSEPVGADVLIKKGTVLRTSDELALAFEVAEDYTIVAGSLTPNTPVVKISPSLTGQNILSTSVRVAAGSSNADLLDGTINLREFVSTGQTFTEIGGDGTTYLIEEVQAAPGAESNNRFVLNQPWAGTSGDISVEVYDTRIELVQGQTTTDEFYPTTDTAGYTAKLSRVGVMDKSVIVTVNGEQWNEVDTLLLAKPAERVFQVTTVATGDTVVQFGDDTFGAAVPEDSVISIVYRVGGGLNGNVYKNAFSTSITGVITSTSSPVTVTITNQTATGIGGRDEETLEEARVNIPFFVRSNDRCVTIDDYQTVAQGFSDPTHGSVAYARASTRSENALLEGNIVGVYAWTTGADGGLVPLSLPLKQSLQEHLFSKAVGTDYPLVMDGTERPVPVSLRFKVFDGYGVTETKRLVKSSLKTFVNKLRPGQPLVFSDLVRTLDEVAGVDAVEMSTPISDLTPLTSTELFTSPSDTYSYTLDRNGSGTPVESQPDGEAISLYVAQLPVYPLQAWSFRLFMGDEELTIVPGIKPGFAQVFGTDLSINLIPASYPKYYSTVNLLTGRVELWIKGAPSELMFQLVTVQGYSRERSVPVYIGYSGDNSQTKRREIRAALRAWADGLPVGGSLFAKEVLGISASKTNITDVVRAVSGVTTVNRVALSTPANDKDRVSAIDTELLKLGDIVLNNQAD
jgi:hypothetical protein